jgi:putative transcriptional regulator
VALDPDKVSEGIGRRIAELRQRRGWTQEQFSVRLRSSFQWVSQIERGRNLTLHSLVKVANALKVSLAELLEPADPSVRRAGPGRPKKKPQ